MNTGLRVMVFQKYLQNCGEYFNVDSTIIRLAAVLLIFMEVGILAYIIAAIVIPEELS